MRGADIYDTVAYPELTYGFSHPARLAAITTLLGLDPAPTATARVLELGCASGLNLIAMAPGLPDAAFVGIDHSARQIERGRAVARDLGLANVELRHADVLDRVPLGQFDIVLAHGLYTWVPDAVRDRVVEVCAEVLAPHGVAMISFNCYPGWAMPAVVRDMMLFRAGRATDPRARVQRAKEVLDLLGEPLPGGDDSAYAAFLVAYRAPRGLGSDDWADASLLHDELEPHNRPCWFHELADHVGRHDLEYLAEAAFGDSLVDDLDPAAVRHAARLADDRLEFEQYLDFLRNRMFRKALVCRAGLAGERTVQLDRLARLTVATLARPAEPDPIRPDAARFALPDGPSFATAHPLSVAAFEHLASVSPASVPFGDLVAAAAARIGAPVAAADVGQLAVTIVSAFGHDVGLADLRTDRPSLATRAGEHPRVSAVARHQAGTGPVVTSLRHTRVELDDASRALVLLADGTRARAALAEALDMDLECLEAELAWLAAAALLDA